MVGCPTLLHAQDRQIHAGKSQVLPGGSVACPMTATLELESRQSTKADAKNGQNSYSPLVNTFPFSKSTKIWIFLTAVWWQVCSFGISCVVHSQWIHPDSTSGECCCSDSMLCSFSRDGLDFYTANRRILAVCGCSCFRVSTVTTRC